MTVAATEDSTEITRTLVDYLGGLGFDDIPAPVVEATKLYILESLAHMLSAQRQRVSRLVVEYLRMVGASPQAIVVGAGLRSSPAEAAYANGTFAHADELESHGTLPGTGLIPPIVAAFTVGDAQPGTTGRDLITATVAGVEMQGRIGTAGIGACDRGFMGISLVGPAGAAVAACRILGVAGEAMGNALGIALPLSNGSLRGCGYMTHVHEAGIPARTGVFAAQLAASGFTGCPDFLDGAHSWGEQFAGGGDRAYAPEKLTEGLGDTLFIETCDVAPKQYGSCGLTHQTMEGTIDLLTEHGLTVDDVESAELIVPPWADRVAAFKEPANGEQAKFSIRQGVAAVLADGVPALPYVRPFSDDTFDDPRYVEARQRVTITIEEGQPNQRAFVEQTVVLRLKDGRTVSKRLTGKQVRGHVDNPYKTDERLDMVRNLLAGIDRARVDAIIDTVMHLEDRAAADVSALVETAD